MNVIIADDFKPVRDLVAQLLDREDDIAVVATVADGHDALEQTARLQPDLLLLDLDMEGMSGLQVLGALDDRPRPRVIVVSLHEAPALIRRALAAGAAGYVSKQSVARELVPAARAIMAGRRYLCKRARASLAVDGDGPG